ncbi:MAG: DEAD/DEAH box helicase [Anaerolineales bacterium]
MDVFGLRNHLVEDYKTYVSSFIQIRDDKIRAYVDDQINSGLLWPDPLIQLNPAFKPGQYIDELVDRNVLHKTCKSIFRRKSNENPGGDRLRLHQHQEDAIQVAQSGKNYVLTTGTGSGKSLSYIIPIVDFVLKNGSGKGIQAVIVYPMNALANSQRGELEKYINLGFPDQRGPVTFDRYTGQESDDEKNRIMANPPDILLTNYVMLELILTRPEEREKLVGRAQGLRFLVLDELHTYRGRQGADVAMLVRRVRNTLNATNLQCIGTSATLSSAGGFEQQRKDVAAVATKLFGDTVLPESIIGETLRRSTVEMDFGTTDALGTLKTRINIPNVKFATYNELINDPLASWIESNIGLKTDDQGRLVRAKPRRMTGEDGAAPILSQLTGIDENTCAAAIAQALLSGYDTINTQTGMPSFAFRLHQFFNRGDTVYASIEKEDERYFTIHGQRFVPGDRSRELLPLVFCRECGQEYYVTRKFKNRDTSRTAFISREFTDRSDDEDTETGYLYLSSTNPWASDNNMYDRLPEDWLEERKVEIQVKQSQRKNLPQLFRLAPSGEEAEDGIQVHFIEGKFRFCLNCGVSYNPRQSSEFAKLTQLSSGGRSTDTTILSLNLIRYLRNNPLLKDNDKVKKLLSFTDNRQDASLQAGHFNDFVEMVLLRAAIYKAVAQAGAAGIHHDVLTQKVFEALGLDFSYYAVDATVRFAQKSETERALREVLGYKIYRDLQRGWRITSPNLEQCGLLDIQYISLDEVCSAEDLWQNVHPALTGATPETRQQICRVLLDFMRRELAIKVDYLDTAYQESMKQLSSQRLEPPWALDETEKLDHSAILFPRPKGQDNDYGGNVYLSAKGGYGQYLKRNATFPDYPIALKTDDVSEMIQQILDALRAGGLVEIVQETKDQSEVNGYQVPASAMIWKVGDGRKPFHDVIRVPRLPTEGAKTNQHFIDFYKSVAKDMHGLEAREHTAQVPNDEREKREKAFRNGELPILYCSPTMELGVDISELNVVNMRNVPPTPANYAQRSGRAGRSGQPALVFTYCTTGSNHDQYYFKRQDRMVAGAVTPPRLDIANQDLLRAHVHAVWLAEANLSLGRSLKDLLDISGDNPTLHVQDFVQAALDSEEAQKKAFQRTKMILSEVEDELKKTDWYNDAWLKGVINQIPNSFNQACQRWRGLYLAAKGQQVAQQKIINDMSRPAQDREQAKRLRSEAESQLELLTDSKNLVQSDFYSYRYFASEGFLPGYSFPRLPLSAFIPARRVRGNKDEFLSRPRFLAISEFGPQSIIYHEGSRYTISKVNLPVAENADGVATMQAKHCPACGYFHPETTGNQDRCERCHANLEPPLTPLFRLQNVSTKRRDRISSDEEERTRQGYEIRTAIRFQETQTGDLSAQSAALIKDGEQLAKLTYASAATISRINVGWKRRANQSQLGFVLDVERGYWAKEKDEQKDAQDNQLSGRTKRVIPFVEDTKNSLLFEPETQLDEKQMASLQAVLKSAIQIKYQLEDNELSAEPLPSAKVRRMILFYESAEGGAGVLRRLLDDPNAFADVAQMALQLCHFDPQTGDDLHHAEGVDETCEAACYNCLMSYYNQMEHRLLDRKEIKNFLMDLTGVVAKTSPSALSREEHLKRLHNLCQSDLEHEWLDFMEQRNLTLPSHAQKLVESCHTRPDFLYEKDCVAIYVDGPHHEFASRKERDKAQAECMEDIGYTVVRFDVKADWDKIIAKHPHIFGVKS